MHEMQQTLAITAYVILEELPIMMGRQQTIQTFGSLVCSHYWHNFSLPLLYHGFVCWFFFWLHLGAYRILIPQNQGLSPRQWNCRVLIAGPPGNSHPLFISRGEITSTEVSVVCIYETVIRGLLSMDMSFRGASLVVVKNPHAMQETWVWSLCL